jgi:UDP-glucose 4-epimerase
MADRQSSGESRLIRLAIDAVAGKGPPLQIFGVDYPTLDGTCERDFINVSDLATAHVDVVRHLSHTKRSFQVNVGSGELSHRKLVRIAQIGGTSEGRWAVHQPQ